MFKMVTTSVNQNKPQTLPIVDHNPHNPVCRTELFQCVAYNAYMPYLLCTETG